jgi:hypothetical protein
MTVPKPTIVTKETCNAVLSRECAARGAEKVDLGAGAGSILAIADRKEKIADVCCCATTSCPVACPSHCPLLREQPLFFGLNYTHHQDCDELKRRAHTPATATTGLDQLFVVAWRLRMAGLWLHVLPHNNTNYTLPAEMQTDYGTPLGPCKAEGRGVFSREWTKAAISMDCDRWEGSIVMGKGV